MQGVRRHEHHHAQGTGEDVSNGAQAVAARVAHGDAFDVREELVALDKGVETRAAEIQSSLFAATDQVGIPEAVASRIADIFGGDIDFHRDLRKGDRLRVMYETLREPGGLDTPTPGRVLGIEFFNAGRRLEAFWFDLPSTAQGGNCPSDTFTTVIIERRTYNPWLCSAHCPARSFCWGC